MVPRRYLSDFVLTLFELIKQGKKQCGLIQTNPAFGEGRETDWQYKHWSNGQNRYAIFR